MKKKVIRLTESDLIRLVKKVIKEDVKMPTVFKYNLDNIKLSLLNNQVILSNTDPITKKKQFIKYNVNGAYDAGTFIPDINFDALIRNLIPTSDGGYTVEVKPNNSMLSKTLVSAIKKDEDAAKKKHKILIDHPNYNKVTKDGWVRFILQPTQIKDVVNKLKANNGEFAKLEIMNGNEPTGAVIKFNMAEDELIKYRA